MEGQQDLIEKPKYLLKTVIKIKHIIFDLDGCLIDTKKMHFDVLNEALFNVTNDTKYLISLEEHSKIYDGLSTKVKLEKLVTEKKLSKNLIQKIYEKKQEFTLKYIKEKFNPNKYIKKLFKNLYNDGYIFSIATNCIRDTTDFFINKLGIYPYVSCILSNNDVKYPKPYSEIYDTAIKVVNVKNFETLIIEDSPHGQIGAKKSGAYLFPVINLNEVTYENIINYIKEIELNHEEKIIFPRKKMNIVIPMSGRGSRFLEKYNLPKPLIPTKPGKPMVQEVIENIGLNANYIFLVLKEHLEKFQFEYILKLLKPNCKIIVVDSVTEGAACTVLLAKEFIDNDEELLICNCDQYVDWGKDMNIINFLYSINNRNADVGLLTFDATGNKWSYAKIDDYGLVEKVAEKVPISNHGLVGFHYYYKGSDFVRSAEKMIECNDRYNNEFYIAPSINYLINEGKQVRIYNIDKFWGTGTPEDLVKFQNEFYGIVEILE